MKKRLYLIGIIVITLIIIINIFVTKKHKEQNNNYSSNQNYTELIEDEKNQYSVENNGEEFVKIDDKIYFWRLSKSSRCSPALWGAYSCENNQKNELICIDSNNNQKVICSDLGFGKIFVSNNKLFLNNYNEISKENVKFYSIDLDGNNKKEYDDIDYILDSNNNYLIYIAKNSSNVMVMNTETNQVTKIFSFDEYKFLKIYNDTIYYIKNINSGDTTITLRSMSADGKNNKVIKEISIEGIDINNQFSKVDLIQFDMDKNNFYISYGYYAGTANMIQDCEICVFKTTNVNDVKIIDSFSKFKLFEKDSIKYLMAISEFDDQKKQVINTQNYNVENIDIPKILENQVVLKDEFMKKYGSSSEEIEPIVNYFEIIGNEAFYILDISEHDPSSDIGWRYSYKLLKTYCIKQNLNTNEYEILYEF